MPLKHFFIKTKNWVNHSLYAQVPIVFFAFALMVLLSYRFMSNIEHEHMLDDVDNMIFNTEAQIASDLLELKATLGSAAETIRIMLLQDEGIDLVMRYMKGITEFMLVDEHLMTYVTSVYGTFDVFDGIYLTGADWIPPDDYVPRDRPWYKAAVEANGKIGSPEPYIDAMTGVLVMTFARRIFDDEGRPLGVVCLDATLEKITEYAVNTYIAKGSYGILLDEEFNVIAHPHPDFVGKTVRDMNNGLVIENELRRGKNISEYKTADYQGDPSILFMRRLKNGWYMAIMAYAKDYYQGVTDIARILIVTGTVLALILSAILFRIIMENQKTNKRTQIMFDTMPLGANFWNSNFENIDCNQEAVRLFELSGKQEYIDRFHELSPEYQPCGRLSEQMALENVKKAFEEGYCRFEWMHQRPTNGESLPCEVTLVRVQHQGGYIVTGYTRDLREYKALLDELHHESEKARIMAHWYENILDTIPLPLSVTDADMNWTFINKATENHLRVNRNDVIGRPCNNWRAEICNTDRCGIYRLKQGLKQTYFRQRGGSYQVDGDILKDLNGELEGFVEVVQDITKLEQTVKKQAEAEASNQAKSNFLARVSHEIRTPMNAILGITEIQLQKEALPPDTEEALGKIYNSGYLLLGIINDILDLSKIEAGKLELVPVRYDVPSLINDTVHLNVMRFDSKPIEFMLELDETIPTTLFGDDLRIKQILNNIISNAFKYTDSGKVTLSVSAESAPRVESERVMLVFRVKDSGQGMTREQVDKLFDEYTRFNVEANRMTTGTGLGMAITKHLLHMMNGEIFVESEPGKGSMFTVRLPQGKIDDGVLGKTLTENLQQFHLGKASQMKKAPQIVREYMPYGRVLVVDDVETNLYVAMGLLSPYGLSLETAASGLEAIDKIKQGSSYDIIFMDHFMPKMDGMEATKNIRDLGYTQPIVALTANALTGQAEVFQANGFDGFISKPIDIRQLNATLNKLVRDRYPPDVLEAARQLKSNLMEQSAVSTPQPHMTEELAGVFIRDAGKAVRTLEAILAKQSALGDEDIQTYIINVHSMKSALANIGEPELSGFALKLEQAGRERDTAVMTEETPAFINALRAIIGKIRPRNDDRSGGIMVGDADYLYEKLATIQTACAAYDKKTAKDALTSLKEKTWPHATREALDAIGEHLLHSEFEKAADIAREHGEDASSL